MADTKETRMIKDLLGDDIVQTIITELGIASEPAEAQVEAVSTLGENIMLRITLETLKQLPLDAHAEFERLQDSGDAEAMKAFLVPYISDWDKFVRREAEKEFEETKTRIHMMEQGVDSAAE